MSTDVADAQHFERIGIAAEGQSAARAREEFARWLERFFDLDPVRSNDLVLAVNEALANAAEFAYAFADEPGTMDVRARYNPKHGQLTVTISDDGTWRIPNPNPDKRNRGRGIPLMTALSDRATIETSSNGTDVCLEWNGVRWA